MADDSEQAGAMGISGGDARCGQRERAGAAEEIIGALGALPVPALDQHRLASHRQQPPALAFDGGLGGCDLFVEQGGGFRQVRRDQ